MDKILVIAEKPSVARDIARVLKCNKKGDGCLIGDEYIVSWAVGHLVCLADPEDYNKELKKWSSNTLPIIPENIKLKAIKQTQSQLKILKELVKNDEIKSLICATDSGREGELIFRYIYNILKCKKPFKRLWISSMTDTAIKEGFKNLKEGTEYDNLYLSAKCRSEADWLVGINATRAYTISYNTLLSIGRVQTPTLSIIVERQKEIDNFDAKPYHEIKAYYEGFWGIWFNKDDKVTKIFDEDNAKQILEKIKDKDGKVINIEDEEKKQPAPLLYDLTELQRDCNKKFGYSAKKTLSIVQSLYETRKMVTYPRTDSRYLSDDMIPKISSTLKKLSFVQEYKKFAEIIIGLEKLPISKRIIDNSKVTDHHAIIPTESNFKIDSLNPEEKNVFNLIAIRFMSVFYPNYIYSIKKVTVDIENEFFLSKGTTIIQKGWAELYSELDKSKEKKNKTEENQDEQTLPPVTVGDNLKVINTEILNKKTQPPKHYTEASLLSAMENAGRFVEDEAIKEQMKDSGLGTPATRAAIIERLISVNYIERKGKALIPTEKGIKLIEIAPTELKSPQTTGKWERGLSQISKGNMSEQRFMDSIKRYVHFLVKDSRNIKKDVVFKAENNNFKPKSKPIGNCPICNEGAIYENSKSFYCSKWKSGCKFTIWKNSLDVYGNVMDNKIASELIKNKKVDNIEITLPQTNERGKATLVLNKDVKTMFEVMNFTRND